MVAVRSADDDEIARALIDLRAAAQRLEEHRRADLDAVAEPDRPSARNLLHYLAIRQFDLRDLQRELARRGLSSLGRAEAHVLATIDAVLDRLGTTRRRGPAATHPAGPSVDDGDELLARHTLAALGPEPAARATRLMVTLPSAAADDPALVDELVRAGMDLARVNTAHDGPDAWRAMIGHVRDAARRHDRDVRVACDLAGPKLRTGPLPPGPRVVRSRPRRNVDGTVQRVARLRFVDVDGQVASGGVTAPDHTTVVVPLSGPVVGTARRGDELDLRDTRGRRRRLVVAGTEPGAVDVTSDRTSYLTPGLPVRLRRDGAVVAEGTVGDLPPTESFLRLQAGDRLRVETGTAEGRPAVLDDQGTVVEPATISCEASDVVAAVAVGHRVLFDDGTIDAVVTAVGDGWFETRVERPEEAKLRAGKGLNLPDSDLAIDAVTPDDVAALEVVAPLTDLVALSFVSRPDDLDRVWTELDRCGRSDVGVVLKIEHAAAFRALPALLLHALRRPPVAVMLARGDLAVEVGFERLAEVQEQVLWLCEAAHVPVVWATQVLESLAKGGTPTRAEVTDAAWGSRAECVMLNKGPYIVEAMRFLSDVFDRMADHQRKRFGMLRRLSVSTGLGDVTGP